MTALARVGVLIAGACLVVLPSTAASAQEEPGGAVDISFDVGAFDPAEADWLIETVQVAGDLEDGKEFTVELTGDDGEVIWSSTETFTAPLIRIPVTEPVAVGDVAAADVSQGISVVPGVQIEPPVLDWKAGGGGGGGQLALSMVMAVLLVAIVFRTPLPSASSQRWVR